MALSDWDTALWNHEGRPCFGAVGIGNSTRLEVYKNRIVVEDENLWEEDSQWGRPTIFMAFRDEPGFTEVAGIRIVTAEAPQSGIFFLAAVGEGEGVRLYGGIGVSGYDYAFDLPKALCAKYGISPAKFGFQGGYGFCWNRETGLPESRLSGEGFDLTWWKGTHQRDRSPESKIYFGVKKETHQAFLEWIDVVAADSSDALRVGSEHLADWISKVSAAGCLRANQGDAFLVDAILGPMAEANSTAPQECAEPIVGQMLSRGERVATSLPYRSHSQWSEARRELAENAGFLRPWMKKLARPAAARKIPVRTPTRPE